MKGSTLRLRKTLWAAGLALCGVAFAGQGCIISSSDDDEGNSGSGNQGADGGGGEGGSACGDGYTPEPGPISRSCGAATDDECDGTVDVNEALPNGQYGNMFDDDCDGLVDEGCLCPEGSFAGDVRDCWLVPASQVDPETNLPTGWCAEHAGGTRKCILDANDVHVWSGECRGAQPPAASDACVAGDFDCDGLELNSAEDCSCFEPEVACPTEPIVTAPYPDPTQLLEIDGESWVLNGAGSLATGWDWTVTGGDCDNILPYPSFAVYDGPDSTTSERIGAVSDTLGEAGTQSGFAIVDGGPQIYPAFALSGDYTVVGKFQLDGVSYSCDVKVQVRAPGIRAEACWTPMPNDMDLHFARLQNSDTCGNGDHGWFDTCEYGEGAEDCYYSNCTGFTSDPSSWGYDRSPTEACHGWGSRRAESAACDNPRLDQDNITCDTSIDDPNAANTGLGDFCGAENINLDNPNDGDRFAVGLHAFGISGEVRSHLNIYCNGERRLSLGYDAASGQQFPVAQISGGDQSGDFWQAVVVEAVVDGSGVMTDCIISPITSTTPNPQTDGSTDFCVDRDPQGGTTTGSSEWLFVSGGGFPANADAMCWH